MQANFDKIINRKGTNSVKWDTLKNNVSSKDILPMWIADMDFETPKPILSAIKKNLDDCPVLGYSNPSDSLLEAIIDWQATHHQLNLTKDEILFSPGVVPSLALIITALTNADDAVLIHDPVYGPFTNMITLNQRKLIRSDLSIHDKQFKMDFTDIEEKIIAENVKLFILCNPHNPGGRVWTPAELKQLATICQKHQVLIISDEIHGDLVYAPHEFTSLATLDPSYRKFVITLTAATKTFNMAGIKNSMIFVQDSALRTKISNEQHKSEQNGINTLGYVATEAAYVHGEVWLEELLEYLAENLSLVTDFFTKELPQIKFLTPEATYLIWFDCSSLGLSDEELTHYLVSVGGLELSPGISFGPAGSQFMRMNIATPRETLREGLRRLNNCFCQNS
ncbi:MalY/PatB family protein [Carnobacterium gallinarum]|uniref:MalY/PatB family protein n=1 Tax=Carnobacterium gallinarum TaxID=2749 RepID=UPI0005569A71|nr:MalY/PatB family protein [Carnobacterium gallinarum]